MRCGKAAAAVVARSVDASTHSADVAQNQPNIVAGRRRNRKWKRTAAAAAAAAGAARNSTWGE